MRIVVLGSWGIGDCVLRAALESPGSEVVGVFTRAVEEGSSDPWRNVVANRAIAIQIPVFLSSQTKGDEGVALLRSLRPDVILSAAHPLILSGEFLRVPRLAALNLHGSLLPRNRGTSPVNWALIRDEKETGLTMHYLDEGIDSGDIVFQKRIAVTDADSPGTLSDKIKAHAGPAVSEALLQLEQSGPLPRTPQDGSRATLAPRLRASDLRIDWAKPARSVWSFIRGTSQPGLYARSRISGLEVMLRMSSQSTRPASRPGEISAADESSIWISCSDTCLQISRSEIEPESARRELAVGMVAA